VFQVLNVPASASPRECRQPASQGSILAWAQFAHLYKRSYALLRSRSERPKVHGSMLVQRSECNVLAVGNDARVWQSICAVVSMLYMCWQAQQKYLQPTSQAGRAEHSGVQQALPLPLPWHHWPGTRQGDCSRPVLPGNVQKKPLLVLSTRVTVTPIYCILPP